MAGIVSKVQPAGRIYDRLKTAAQERAQARNGRESERVSRTKTSLKKAEEKSVRLIAYGGPLVVATFKDLLDIVLLGSFPGIGTVITFCFFFLIFLLLFVSDGVTTRPKTLFLFQAGGLLISGAATEGFVFGLNFFPISIGVVLGIYLREKAYGVAPIGLSAARR